GHPDRAWAPKREKGPGFEGESLIQRFYTLWAENGPASSGYPSEPPQATPSIGRLAPLMLRDTAWKLSTQTA
ncbi:hypothetical protein ACIPIN_21835, partial [Pseudomonas sp. NPDC087697]|uniref:hypothetical protein n=1 Tax=Pseudomonas sp. NPDC087697 TaxID=3364447 RepID=UPI00380C6ACA